MVTNYAFTYATRDDSASVLQGGELATYRKRKRERERVRERERSYASGNANFQIHTSRSSQQSGQTEIGDFTTYGEAAAAKGTTSLT